MESSVSSGMCRCCASEGTFKDINAKYYWMGEEEIYSEMLNDCFNISLNESSQNGDSGICEVCITQLRNSVNFKKQVLNTEDQFKNHLESKMFKECEIKVEYTQEDSTMESESNGSDEDYSAIEFVVPLKKEEEDSKPKKRSSSSKPSTSRGKKPKKERVNKSTSKTSKTPKKKIKTNDKLSQSKRRTVAHEKEDITSQPSSRKRDNVITPSPRIGSGKKKIIILGNSDKQQSSPGTDTRQPRKKTITIVTKNDAKLVFRKKNDIDKHQDNIKMVLTNSNATPIKSKGGIGYMCCFCTQQYPEASDLKKHTLENHINSIPTFMDGIKLPNFIVKLDITRLKCNICDKEFDELETFMEHLRLDHIKLVHTDIKSHVVPFKFDTDRLICVVCKNDFNNFKVLLMHMNAHYRNYICEVCGSGFVNKRILLAHHYRHVTGVFTCEFCSKIFDTRVKQKDHERAVHKLFNKRNKCGYCGEKFFDYTKKNDHEVKVHGVKPVVLSCQACFKTFDNQRSLTTHTKRYHLMEKWRAKARC